MAPTGKKTTSSSSRSGAGKSASSGRGGTAAKSGGKRTTQAKGKTTGKKPAAPARKPYRREVGAVVCLLLAFVGAIG